LLSTASCKKRNPNSSKTTGSFLMGYSKQHQYTRSYLLLNLSTDSCTHSAPRIALPSAKTQILVGPQIGISDRETDEVNYLRLFLLSSCCCICCCVTPRDVRQIIHCNTHWSKHCNTHMLLRCKRTTIWDSSFSPSLRPLLHCWKLGSFVLSGPCLHHIYKYTV